MLLGALTLMQLSFWQQTKDYRPSLDIVPVPPGEQSVEALTFGDDEFYFRVLALQLQNFGDSYGRFTALRNYDYARLYSWMTLLDTLDARSNMLPAMAAYYFSQTQNREDVRYMTDYLYEHATRDVADKWWWLMQGSYLASHKLNDMDLALKMAQPMVNPDVPAYAQQMVAVVHEKRGEMNDALTIMETIRDNAKYITENDLKFMRYFVENRLHALDKLSPPSPDAATPQPGNGSLAPPASGEFTPPRQ